MRKSIVCTVFLLIILTLLGGIFSTAQTGVVDLKLIGVEDFDDNSYYDITAVWVGHTSNELAFVIRMYNLTSYPELEPVGVNITLETETNDLYLIQAIYTNSSDTLVLTEADNLVDNPIAANDSNPLYYLADRVFFNPNLGELGFLIDWADIGGEQAINFVVWGMSLELGSEDRFPNSSSATYDLNNSDRQLDFLAALQGNFETTDVLSPIDAISTTSTERLGETKTTDLIDISTGNPTVSSSSSNILFFFVILGILLGLFIFRDKLFGPKDEYDGNGEEPFKPFKTDNRSPPRRTSLSYQPQISQKERTPEVQMKYIPELNREIRMCCYQTARLNETYCWCGRAIDEDVRQLFSNDTKYR